MYQYLRDNGMTRDEYAWFMQTGEAMRPYCVMGNDYYITNEHNVFAEDQPITRAGEIFGYYVITKQYYDRYHLPVMHTETNLGDAQKAPAWLHKEWANMMRLRLDGVPLVGFTWYSLTDQVDWDTVLRENNGHVNPLGLYDLNRKIRPVGIAYRELIANWHKMLPLESYCFSGTAGGGNV
jgi:beta-glucosidase/6-phospho-beta-glucosidase/beta-galactosidase